MNNAGVDNTIKQIAVANNAVVRMVISNDNWLESAAVEQLKKVAELDGMRFVIGMPDLHPGKGQPVGASFISEGLLYPHLVGNDIGCGMGLWKLHTSRQKVSVAKWEKRLLSMADTRSADEKLEPAIGEELSLHQDGCGQLGTIGSGNHFAEVQVINEIHCAETFSELGLDANAPVLLVHSGSRGLGQRLLEEHLSRFGAHGLAGNAASTYLANHDAAERWAIANRCAIAARFTHALGIGSTPLLDVSHNHMRLLSCEQISSLGVKTSNDSWWIHRKGAAPADRGAVIIPGSRGSLTYLVRPRIEDRQVLALAGFSLAHGAGRKWKRSDCKGRLSQRYRVQDLETTTFGGRVICKARDLMYEEAPQAYKDIGRVIGDLEQAGLVQVLANFKPLLTFKTTGKS